LRRTKTDILHFLRHYKDGYTQGDTYEEVIENIKDAIRLHLEDRKESGESLPKPESISVTALKVSVWPARFSLFLLKRQLVQLRNLGFISPDNQEVIRFTRTKRVDGLPFLIIKGKFYIQRLFPV
jgi:hypothetical protein